MIILQDIISYKNISCPNELLEQVKIIAEHTKNTWQLNRPLDDIYERIFKKSQNIHNGDKIHKDH